MKKKYTKIFKIIVSILLLIILFKFVDLREVFGNLVKVDIKYIILFVLLNFLSIVISTNKWRRLAQAQGFKKSAFFYFKTYFVGVFLNNFFPSFIGGDAYRIFSLNSSQKSIAKASQSVVFDRISGLVTVIFLSAFFGVLLVITRESSDVLNLLVFGSCLVSILIFIFLYFFNSKFIQKILSLFPKKVLEYILSLNKLVFSKVGMISIFYSVLFAFEALAFSNYILFLAFGEIINPLSFLSVIFLISIISSLPISIGNIGVKEWAYVTLFGIFGISASIAVSVVFLSRVLQMFISTLAIPFYLSGKKSQK